MKFACPTASLPSNLLICPFLIMCIQRSPVSLRHSWLFFVSSGRAGGHGADDIYFTRFNPGAWEEPQNVGCHINSTAGEASPSYFEDESGRAINL